ncbi:MAG: hypothetical protein AAF541_06800 [Pseudomonadota bacterium]
MEPGDNKKSAASMQRTKIQLATTYSPGTLFTFEGNLVVCESHPSPKPDRANLALYVREQILSAIEEKVHAWYSAAISTAPHTTARMCVDEGLINREQLQEPFPRHKFGFVEPKELGYQPTLLTMVCNTCKLVRAFEDLKRFESDASDLDPKNCPDPMSEGNCHWRQSDIVFVHPNGTYCQPVPWRYDWDNESSSVRKFDYSCSRCGSTEVRLNDDSNQVGKRFFYCAECKMPRNAQWLQNDRELLRQYRDQSHSHIAEIRMKPVSYRANSVQYPQHDMVIDFGDSEQLEILSDLTHRKLINFIGERFQIESGAMQDSDIESAVRTKLGDQRWEEFRKKKESVNSIRALASENKDLKPALDALGREIDQQIDQWRTQGVIEDSIKLPIEVLENLANRRERFATKFDPFRLLVEHSALLETVVNESYLASGLRSYTPLDQLDEHVGPSQEEARSELNQKHREIMDRIGIETLGLVRDFRTTNYSFGFTRVGSTPRINYINDTEVPVRLKLFPRVQIDEGEKAQHPVYVLKQANEAIYVRLSESDVRRWMTDIAPLGGVDDTPIGLQYLSRVPELNPFLDNLPGHDLDAPHFSLALYGLLHTYAHHVINAVSEFSGLSTGSLGEYLFPSDLAFLVFRRGMTMDLGNLTAMLRNNAPAFLNYLVDPRSLECGSGSLCINRGGACPDCLMIPEVNCLTQNKLLSRSLLIGKGSPRLHGFDESVNGYFETITSNES